MMTATRIALLLCAFAAGACTSASLEDAAPRSLLPPPASPAPVAADGTGPSPSPARDAGAGEAPAAPALPPLAKARDTRQFPNINVVPKGQTAQISPAQRAEAVSELNAARNAQRSAGASAGAGSAAELNQLGRTHARRALDDIESE